MLCGGLEGDSVTPDGSAQMRRARGTAFRIVFHPPSVQVHESY